MRWKRGAGDSGDVIDARGGGGGGRGGLPIGRAGGGVSVLGIVIYLAFQLLGGGGGGGGFAVDDPFSGTARAPENRPIPASQDPDRDLKDFSAYVFTNTQKTWEATIGPRYEHAKLVLFSGGVNTGCGSASSAVGPFYCPPDKRVYLDLSFYRDMTGKLGARGGDFAWAYVIAHEMGHHVQEELGTNDRVDQLRRDEPSSANALSVRTELQADCYAGVWAHAVFTAGDLEDGDIDEALRAASAVGDDRLQRAATGTIRPDTFTHGTSQQRSKWFRTGYKGGEPAACDTFSPGSV